METVLPGSTDKNYDFDSLEEDIHDIKIHGAVIKKIKIKFDKDFVNV